MKKFFVALLVLAIVAGNLFAEVSWGGYALNALTVVRGSSAEDSDLKAGQGLPDASLWGLYGLGRIQASATNDDGTFGAFVRTGVNTGGGGDWGYRSWVWWQPISQIRLKIGFFDDMAVNYVVGWGFHANSAPDTVAYGSWGRAGGWSYDGEITGALLTLAPIEGLSIKIGVPYVAAGTDKAAEVYNHIIGQVAYDIANIGQIAVTFEGNNNRFAFDPTFNINNPDPSLITAQANIVRGQFYLTAVENLSLNIGVKYTLPVTEEFEVGAPDKLKITRNTPIVAGFGAAYAVSDTFGVKARFHADLAGGWKTGDADEIKDDTKIGFDLLPYFDVSVVKIFLYMGIDVALPDKSDSDTVFNWFFNPYITKSAGGGTFYAGLALFSNKTFKADGKIDKDIINWGIPIGLEYGF